MALENKKISIPTVDGKLKDGNNFSCWAWRIWIYKNLLGSNQFSDQQQNRSANLLALKERIFTIALWNSRRSTTIIENVYTIAKLMQ
jgi:hypothetical protein